VIDSLKVIARVNIGLGKEMAAQAALSKLLADYSDHEKISEAIEGIADSYLDSNKYTQARQLYQTVLNNWPASEYAIWAQQGLVLTCISSKDEAGIIPAFDKLISDFSHNKDLPQAISDTVWAFAKYGEDDVGTLQYYQYIASEYKRVALLFPNVQVIADMDLQGIQMVKFAWSYKAGNNVKASGLLDTLVNDYGNHDYLPTVLLRVGEEYFLKSTEMDAQGRISESLQCLPIAISVLEKVANHSSRDRLTEESSYYLLGNAYYMLEDYLNSLRCFQKIVDDHPDFIYAYYAQLMVGRSFIGMVSSGLMTEDQGLPLIKAAYQQLMADYPENPSAGYVQNWLNNNNSK